MTQYDDDDAFENGVLRDFAVKVRFPPNFKHRMASLNHKFFKDLSAERTAPSTRSKTS